MVNIYMICVLVCNNNVCQLLYAWNQQIDEDDYRLYHFIREEFPHSYIKVN